eukprot:GHVS01104146.1.p1 GENE.GHVS01104146.1~~GHVS01104146.1.p1  ORF type:complete len:567 (+),score=110.88 GHVS01104146.1:537-2237(+)
MEPQISAHYVSFLNSSSSTIPDDGVDEIIGNDGRDYPLCLGTNNTTTTAHLLHTTSPHHPSAPTPGFRGDVFGGVRRVLGGRGGRKDSVVVAWTLLVTLLCLTSMFAVFLLLVSSAPHLQNESNFVDRRAVTNNNHLTATTPNTNGIAVANNNNRMSGENNQQQWTLPDGIVAVEELKLASSNLSSPPTTTTPEVGQQQTTSVKHDVVVGDASVWGHGDSGGLRNGVAGLRPPLIWMWDESDFTAEFDVFMKSFDKTYYDGQQNGEFKYRFGIFKKNVYFIHSHNSQDLGYKVRMNKFGDLTFDEFKKNYFGYRPSNPLKSSNGVKSLGLDLELLTMAETDVPKSVDWRAKGCVSEVKDQKQCGSCWAFSTTGALEGAYCAQQANGTLLDLSEQQLVDCGKPEGNMGCDGGEMDDGFQYVIDNKGICSEEDYPYKAVVGKCNAHHCKNVLHIKGFKDVPVNNELAMKAALSLRGPVSVGIEADLPGFQFYSHGVFGGKCGNSLDHGVLAVGYGTDEKTGTDYWIVKNSWGPNWGDHGFIRLAQHKKDGGECGILETPSYPIVATLG